jgi:hypothetical protein
VPFLEADEDVDLAGRLILFPGQREPPSGTGSQRGLYEPPAVLLTPVAPPRPAAVSSSGTAGPTAVHAEPFHRLTNMSVFAMGCPLSAV